MMTCFKIDQVSPKKQRKNQNQAHITASNWCNSEILLLQKSSTHSYQRKCISESKKRSVHEPIQNNWSGGDFELMSFCFLRSKNMVLVLFHIFLPIIKSVSPVTSQQNLPISQRLYSFPAFVYQSIFFWIKIVITIRQK